MKWLKKRLTLQNTIFFYNVYLYVKGEMNMFQELITTCRVVLPPLERYVRQLSPALQVHWDS